MDLNIWSALIVSLLAIWLALPLQVVIHEFSHALAASILSPSKIIVKLGQKFHGVYRKGRWNISFGLYRWNQGSTHYISARVRPVSQAIIILAGPLGTLMVTILAGYALSALETLWVQLALVPFIVYGLKILVLSLYPRQLLDKETGRKIQTDGYRLSRVPWQMTQAANPQ